MSAFRPTVAEGGVSSAGRGRAKSFDDPMCRGAARARIGQAATERIMTATRWGYCLISL